MIILQQILDDALAPLYAELAQAQADLAVAQAQVGPLQAQVNSLNAQVTTLNAEIDALEAQIVPPPVPSTANTGYRGGLGNYSATQFPTANNVTIANMQVTFSAPLSIPGDNIVMKNGRFNSATVQPLTISGAGFVAEDFTFANVTVTGKGTFTRCNFGNGVTLNGVSIVKDSYVKGTLTTFAGSTLTNNTVVP